MANQSDGENLIEAIARDYLRWRHFQSCGLHCSFVSCVYYDHYSPSSLCLNVPLYITMTTSHAQQERQLLLMERMSGKIDSIVESQKKLEDANRSLLQENERLRLELQKKEKQNRCGSRTSRRSSTLEIPSELRVSRPVLYFFHKSFGSIYDIKCTISGWKLCLKRVFKNSARDRARDTYGPIAWAKYISYKCFLMSWYIK